MTTVIEAFNLFETGEYENTSKEERFKNLVKVFFVSDDVETEKNVSVISGRLLYYVDLKLIIKHEGLMYPLNYQDVALALSHFCRSLRILKDDGTERFYYTAAN